MLTPFSLYNVSGFPTAVDVIFCPNEVNEMIAKNPIKELRNISVVLIKFIQVKDDNSCKVVALNA
jgi:hypothetical protein